MDQVKVEKDRLLEALKDNRQRHENEYTSAMEAYREQAISALRKRIADIESGTDVDLSFALPRPVEYLDSFDEAIAMLEWENEDEIKLDQRDFQRFVLNKWEWAHQFRAATSMYNVQ